MIYFSFLFHHQETLNLHPQVALDGHLLILGWFPEPAAPDVQKFALYTILKYFHFDGEFLRTVQTRKLEILYFFLPIISKNLNVIFYHLKVKITF